MNREKKKISKGIGIAACLVVATTGIVFAKDIGNFFSNLFNGNASDGVQIAVDNGYVEKLIFWGGYSMYAEKINSNELMIHLTAYGSEEHKIPKSKKLFVTVTKIANINYAFGNPEDIIEKVFTGDWKFEIDVPEEMYNREKFI